MNHDVVRRWDVFVYLTEYYNHRTEAQHDALKEALSRVPSAEPERKKGKWIEIPDEIFASTYKCSECGEAPLSDGEEWVLSNYCPNCGADMRGEQE